MKRLYRKLIHAYGDKSIVATIANLFRKEEAVKVVDEEITKLESVKTEIVARQPELEKIDQTDLLKNNWGSYKLWFKHTNRSCCIYYYGYDPDPRFVFKWDGSDMFEVSTSDIGQMSSLIKKWVLDEEKSTVLKTEFTDIDFGKLVHYYEAGNGIVGEFVMSWDDVACFFESGHLKQKEEIVKLISIMRDKGFDETLRAGTSLFSLVLSRSRRYGLRDEQHRVSFDFVYIQSKMAVRVRPGETVNFDTIEYNDAIEGWLRALEQQPID